MKAWLSCALVAVFAAASVPSFAADNPQQDKMKACNAHAGDKKGDERKAFMKDCLSAKPAKPDNSNKMAACNTKSKGMKGDERKKFMSECMKGSA
jgi:hypothetical protein